ncbi:FeoB-associated Cys-rich membrane protein [Rubrolithibacter danxiaensis]|uniref:FeoB-associated Cys-rich membrane protein n=1 Tax=Rubrolithibacter danxiaensis TaxID=3390805 RepID=UPI003BF88A3C
MTAQEIIVIALFVIALVYIGRMIYRNLKAKDGCGENCKGCGVDFTKIKVPEK